MLGSLAAFLGVAAVVIVTPGPDTALTVRNTLLGGRRGGIATAAGVATGQGTWALFSAAGVAALLQQSQPAFVALRIAGAGYLVYLGLRVLAGALGTRPAHPLEVDGDGTLGRPGAAYRQGLISNLVNPKMVVFFVSLLPQFTGSHASFMALPPPPPDSPLHRRRQRCGARDARTAPGKRRPLTADAATLGGALNRSGQCAFDDEHSLGPTDVAPPERDELTAPQAGVRGDAQKLAELAVLVTQRLGDLGRLVGPGDPPRPGLRRASKCSTCSTVKTSIRPGPSSRRLGVAAAGFSVSPELARWFRHASARSRNVGPAARCVSS